MVRTRSPSNVIDLAEERARRHRIAFNSMPISTAMFQIATYNMLSWAAYWRLAMNGFRSPRQNP